MKLFSRSNRRIRREAADWAARLGGDPAAADMDRYRQWRAADPRNAAAYDRMAAIWHGAARANRPADRSVAARPGNWGFGLAAASAALAVCLILLLPGIRLSSGPPLLLASSIRETRSVDLADGSNAGVGPGTLAEFSMGKHERRIDLRKGALRLLARQEERPFIVEVAGYEALANGALIEVTGEPARATVTALEGKVEVRPAGLIRRMLEEEMWIGPGQQAVIDKSGARIEKVLSAAPAMIEFDEAPLSEALLAINRSGNVRVRVGSPEIGRLKLSGAYRVGDAASFANSVAMAFSLRVERLGDGSLILVASH